MNAAFTDFMNNLPLMMIVVAALAAMLAEAVRGTRPDAVSSIGMAGAIIAAVIAVTRLDAAGESFGGMIRHDGYANYFTALFSLVAFFTMVFSRNYFAKMKYHRGEFYILVLFATAGMILIASANDLVIIFLGIELMSICLYVLAGFFRVRERSNEAGLKYFLLGAFATGFLLYGIALIYGASGTTNLTLLREKFSAISGEPLFVIGIGLLLIGFSFKAAAVPFHMWVPDVYEGAPTTVSGFMSTAAKAAAFSALITVFIRSFDFLGGKVSGLLALIAAASMILGNTIAIAQTNVKRLLAYSSIAHAGYMLAGIAAGSPDGRIGVMYYLSAYAFMNLGAFAVIGFVEGENDTRLSIDDYAGLAKSQPLLAALMSVFMFALAGVPPFAGFFGKYYVFLAAVKSDMTWLAVVGVLMSLVSAYYYLRIVVTMYFRDGKADLQERPSRAAAISTAVCAAIILLLGVYPSLIVDIARRLS